MGTVRSICTWSEEDFPGEPITFDIYKLYINEKYNVMYGRNGNSGNELTLAANDDRDEEEDSEEESKDEEYSEEDESEDNRKRTTGKFIGCFYCGDKNHSKRNCRKWIKERDQLYCSYCAVNGHDNTTCFLLHPNMKNRKGGVRRFTKFGAQCNDNNDSD